MRTFWDLESIETFLKQINFKEIYVPVAQLVEHSAVNRKVASSSLAGDVWPRGLAWLEHSTDNREVLGSNPGGARFY